MGQKTIPQLTEATSGDANTLFPIDSGTQTFKMTAPNVGKLALEQAPRNLFVSIYNAAKTYALNDVVFYSGVFYSALGASTNKTPSTQPLYWKKLSQAGLNPQASSALAVRAVGAWTGSGSALFLNVPAYSPELKRWVVGSYSGDLYYSDDDGATWTAGTAPAGTPITNWSACAWSPELKKFVAVGNDSAGGGGASANQLAYSTDGATWTAATNPATGIGYFGVKWLPEFGKFVAVGALQSAGGSAADAVVVSTDGTSWTQITGVPEGTWAGLAYAPGIGAGAGRLVACSFTATAPGTYDRFMYSDDAGATWTVVLLVADRVTRTCLWVEEWALFICPTSNDKILYSQDGITWNDAAAPGTTGVDWYEVAYSPELNIAVIGSTDSRDILYSQDGLTWTRITNALTNGEVWSRAMWSSVAGVFRFLNAGVTGSNNICTCRHVKQFIAV